jgi:transcriptional regulator with XRE-family HTH domain
MLTGDFLRQLRTLRGIKQTVIAKKLGISQQAYSKLEKCKEIDKNREDNLLMILQCNKEDVEDLAKIFSPVK